LAKLLSEKTIKGLAKEVTSGKAILSTILV